MSRCYGQPHAYVFSDSYGKGEAVAPPKESYDPQYHMCFDDINVNGLTAPAWIQVTIKASKTDPFRLGVKLYLRSTGGEICPVAAILEYMVARGKHSGPLFIWEDGKYLTRETYMTSVRSALTAAGYNALDYAGHSFRIGAATTAAQRGIQDSMIKTLGQWESSAYTRYICTAPEVLWKVSKTLVN